MGSFDYAQVILLYFYLVLIVSVDNQDEKKILIEKHARMVVQLYVLIWPQHILLIVFVFKIIKCSENSGMTFFTIDL